MWAHRLFVKVRAWYSRFLHYLYLLIVRHLGLQLCLLERTDQDLGRIVDTAALRDRPLFVTFLLGVHLGAKHWRTYLFATSVNEASCH